MVSLRWRRLEFVYHYSYTTSGMVVLHYKSCFSSLDKFQFINIVFSIGGPTAHSIFQNCSYVYKVGIRFYFTFTCVHVSLLKCYKVLFAFLQTESTCLLKLSFESMMTPKYLASFTFRSGWSYSVYE